ncbi:TRAP transporter large permease [Azospirillum sp. RWY-5-1]|uniref:TRAP transporter large permease protein n=1 Tax=Azospirillum oleiclasticum TaxID=2735135 RepID=A0ABX2T3T0_9PROT|nr:TRAP transporter large permease [Azospirillum oleiclasticum]NYZ11815.1 TRAP transporter large permease [Azospirillum oleiclasticum]NYZ18975.1 TRAP transporter large permease [Azospirillum oleiclasticum]
MLQALYAQSFELGWTFYGPLIGLGVLLVLGVPIWVALGLGTVAILSQTQALPMGLMGETLFSGVDSFALIALPLFILTGDVIVTSRLSDKLLDFAEALLGWVRSGLGTSTILGCGFFGAISGSNAADCAAVGRITIPRLVQRGYPIQYAAAIVAAGACTAILIPPSIAYILVGITLGVSAAQLFAAAVVPGVFFLGWIIATNVVVNRRRNYEKSTGRLDPSEVMRTGWEARYALMVPVIILGGIYTGIFTPTEAASVAVIVAITIGFGTRRLRLSDFPAMMERSAEVTGIIGPIIGVALVLSQTLSALGVPIAIVNALGTLVENPPLVIALMFGLFIVAGCIMETTPIILLLSPILWPVGEAIGMTPVHFSVFMISSLAIGFITPPIGLNLFVVSGLTGESVTSIAARSWPFVLGMCVPALLIGFWPQLFFWF